MQCDRLMPMIRSSICTLCRKIPTAAWPLMMIAMHCFTRSVITVGWFVLRAAASVVVIAPSHPLVSIGPILAVPGMPELLDGARRRVARIVAVSGIIGGKALKGPADRMLASLGHEASAVGVARGYAGLIDAFVLDDVDAELAPAVEALGVRAVVTDTIMTDDASRARLARDVLAAATA